jgi:hypothetical protein
LDYILKNNLTAYASFKTALNASPSLIQAQTTCPNSLAETEELTSDFIFLHPNPTAGELLFDTNEEVQVVVTDQTGKVLIEKLSSGKLNVENLSSGIYYLSVAGRKARFVKQ